MPETNTESIPFQHGSDFQKRVRFSWDIIMEARWLYLLYYLLLLTDTFPLAVSHKGYVWNLKKAAFAGDIKAHLNSMFA